MVGIELNDLIPSGDSRLPLHVELNHFNNYRLSLQYRWVPSQQTRTFWRPDIVISNIGRWFFQSGQPGSRAGGADGAACLTG